MDEPSFGRATVSSVNPKSHAPRTLLYILSAFALQSSYLLFHPPHKTLRSVEAVTYKCMNNSNECISVYMSGSPVTHHTRKQENKVGYIVLCATSKAVSVGKKYLFHGILFSLIIVQYS